MNCRFCGSPLPADALFCVECGRSVAEVSVPTVRTPPRPPRAESGAAPSGESPEVPESMPESVPAPSDAAAEAGPPPLPEQEPQPATDVEATRMMASRGHGERFVLQFSTGESFVVAGTGIVGRNPAAEPGEFVDMLVAVFDVGKSVSKSHAEFGQEAGTFWVSDRHSTNGTIVRQPDAEPVRCEPGKRYHVARGTRVDIGDQFFVVS